MKRVAKFQEGGMASSGISNEPVGAALRRLFQRRAPMQGPPAPGGGQRPQEDRARMAEEAAPRFDEEERMLMERRRNRGSAITNQPVGERLAGRRPAPAPEPQATGRSYPIGEGGTLQPESTQRPTATPPRPRAAPRSAAREATTAEDLNEIVLRLTRGEKPVTETEKRIADRMGIAYKKGGMVNKYQAGGRVRPLTDEEGGTPLQMERQKQRRQAAVADREYYSAPSEYGRLKRQLQNWEAGRRADQAERAAGLFEEREPTTKFDARLRDEQSLNSPAIEELRRNVARGNRNMKREKAEEYKKGGTVKPKTAMKKGGMVKPKAPATKMKSGGKVAPKKMMKGGMTSKPKKMMGGGRAMYAKGGMAKGCK